MEVQEGHGGRWLGVQSLLEHLLSPPQTDRPQHSGDSDERSGLSHQRKYQGKNL